MTKHLATVKQLVDCLGVKTQAKQVINITGTADFWKVYNDNHDAIDGLFKTLYANYVLSEVSSPDETTEDVILFELSQMSREFIMACEEPLKRLWMLESVEFNPVENYDRHENLSHVKTGSEEVTGANTADNSDTKSDTGTDINATVQNGEVDNTNSGGITSEENTNDTSYNTNLVNTVTNETTDTTKTVTEYKQLETRTSIEKGTTSALVHKADETHQESRVYNNVTDAEENHIHGNIGVTTATAMMDEYQQFYSTYSFWKKFWKMYITLFASPVFDAERGDYY